MRPQPMLCASDVEATSRWFQQLLGLVSDHGGPHYERLITKDGRLVLQLHKWETEHHHGAIGDPSLPRGNGVIVWLEVDDFEAAAARAAELKAEVVIARHRNPPDGDGGPNHWELWLRDPNGYLVVLASPDGTADGNWQPSRPVERDNGQ